MSFILSVLDWFKSRIFGIGTVLAAFVALLMTMKRAGQQSERLKQLEEILGNVGKKDGAAQKVDRLPDGDAARRLRDEWRRD